MEMQERLSRIRAEAQALGVDVLITTDQANIRYATGFQGEPHTLFLTANEAVLYTSFRTLAWAERQTSSLRLELELSTAPSPMEDIVRRLSDGGVKIGVDQRLSHLGFQALEEKFSRHTLVVATPIERCRRVKSAAEIEILERSQRINESIFEAVLTHIKPGLSERAVQGIMLAEIALREEVDGYSFNPIVAAAGNAWEIHHLPDGTKIERGDMLLLDLGIVFQGYASDMTRTICMGKATPRMHEIYDTVSEAQEAAIGMMKPGAWTHEVDAVARNIISEAGHGKGFTHGLGHSIGLETHDPGLNLSRSGPNEILMAGMAFTVEPGIYLEDEFGVRTEDVVIVTEDGYRNITRQSKSLLELNF